MHTYIYIYIIRLSKYMAYAQNKSTDTSLHLSPSNSEAAPAPSSEWASHAMAQKNRARSLPVVFLYIQELQAVLKTLIWFLNAKKVQYIYIYIQIQLGGFGCGFIHGPFLIGRLGGICPYWRWLLLPTWRQRSWIKHGEIPVLGLCMSFSWVLLNLPAHCLAKNA